MIRRASGIFLWVVLVVQILIVEYGRGQIHALRRRLNEIPDDLHKLFNEILARDNQPGSELVLCLQWILYARVPLQLKELYFAVRIGMEPDSVSAWDPESITEDGMERYILYCSKGLAKSTKAERKTIQFIHETVRDFFLKSSKLHIPCFGLANPFTARSHDRLWRCCQEYYHKFYLDQLTSELGSLEEATGAGVELSPSSIRDNVSWWPFLQYAMHDALYHAEAAVTSGHSPKTALRDFRLEEWIIVNNLSAYRQYPKNTGLLCILADKNLPRLLQVEVNRQMTSSTDIDQSLWCYAAGFGDESELKMLLARDDIAINTIDNQLRTPLHWAVLNRQDNVANVTFLLNVGKIGLNVKDRQGRTPLSLAADAGQHSIVELLLIYSEVDADTRDIRGMTPLWLATEAGTSAVVDVLLESRRVNPNILDREGRDLFNIAVQRLTERCLAKRYPDGALQDYRIQLNLLEKMNKARLFMALGAPISLERVYCCTLFERESVARSLLASDLVIPDFEDSVGRTALGRAAEENADYVVRLLMSSSRVDPNHRDYTGRTPLSWAAGKGAEQVVRVLLDCDDVKVDLRDRDHLSPEDWAIKAKAKNVVDLFQENRLRR